MKKIVVILTIMNSFFVNSMLKAQNPKFICITCGSFDLAKVNFGENLNELGAKTKIVTKASVQSYTDQTKTYETLFLFKNNQNSGVEIITYQDWLRFSNVNVLTNADKKIIAYNAFSFYDGPLTKIDDFVNKLKNKFKTSTLITGKGIDGAVVYQWYLDDIVVQLERDLKQEKESSNVGGKWVEKKTCHVKLTIYNKALLDDKMKKALSRNIYFLLYQKEHFIKEIK
jgi:hypothetical protein